MRYGKQSSNYVQCLNIAPMEKAWFMTSLRYRSNGKDIMAIMETTWFCERLFFEVLIVMVKDKKIQYKRYNVNNISFMH